MTAAFDAHGVTYMVADWTNYNADIARFINQHGRTGIPLYLLYPADSSEQPLILPQILTKNLMLKALNSISDKKAEVTATF